MSACVRARAFLATAGLLALAAIPDVLVAQGTGSIEGTVTAAGNRRPIAGVQVSVVGTGGRVGTLTDAKGMFRILNVDVGRRSVRARLLGYTLLEKVAEVTANGTVTVAFELQQTAVELNAVVTTGTGGSQVEARKLGNTVASIKPPANAPIASFSDVLQGREPGVMALPSSGLTGEGARIRIRGNASLSQSNEPIVYVDGVRIDNGGGFGNGFVGTGGGGRPSRLDDIDPTVIEKVEILKGAAAATLYGTEASNGVVLITTKKGVVSAPRWQFELDQGMKSYPTSRVEDQWGIARSDTQAVRLSQHYGQTITAFTPFSKDVATQLYETGRMSTVAGQVSGGTPLLTYFGSVRGYMEDGPFSAKKFDWADAQGAKVGVFSQDLNNKYSGTLSMSLTPASAIKVSSTVLYTHAYNEIPENNNSIYAPYTVSLFSKPENAQCDASRAAGLNVATNGSLGNGYCAGKGNPTGASSFGSGRELVQPTTKQNARHFNGNLRTSYLPNQSFNLDATFGLDFTAARSATLLPFGNNVDLRINRANGGFANLDDRLHQEVTMSVNGGYNHELPMTMTSNTIFGMQGFITRENDESSTNQGFPGPGIEVVGGGSSPQAFESFSSIVNAGSFLQEQLGYHDWLFTTFGGRYDYNSAFGKTSGGVFYPQASLSVIPSDRAGWSGSFPARFVSSLRFRGAMGQAGRQPDAFAKLTTYTALTATSGSGLVPANLGNPNLRPEISTEYEGGAEFGIRNDKTSFGFTAWKRNTKDALYARQFPVTGGFQRSQLDNVAELEANGWDARVKTDVVNRPNLSVDAYANIGFLSQNVKSLGGAPPIKVGGSYPRYRNFVIEGSAPGAYFGAKVPGACPGSSQYLPIQSTTPATKTTGGVCLLPGQLPFDTNGDGIPDTQAQVLAFLAGPRALGAINPISADDDNDGDKLDHADGKPLPDFEGSFGLSATVFTNWRIGTNLEYRFGNYKISDLTGAFRRGSPTNGGNTELRAKQEGILLNPASTPQARVDAATVAAYNLTGLSPFDGMNQQFSGDFLRWRELSVTYSTPRAWASKLAASDMQITLAAKNFALWTKYPGVDPEVNLFGRGTGGGTTTNFAESIDAFGFPIPRTFSLNVRIGY